MAVIIVLKNGLKMNRMMAFRQILITLFIILSTVSTCVHAYPIEGFLGYGSGYRWTDTEFSDGLRTGLGETEAPSYTDVTHSGFPLILYAGFRFHPYYGAEAGFLSLGTVGFTKTLTTTDDSTGGFISSNERDAKVESSGFFIAHVFHWPVVQNIDLNAKLGLIVGSTDYIDRNTDISPASDADGNATTISSSSTERSSQSFAGGYYAVGASWRFSQSSAVGWNIQQVEVNHKEERESFVQWLSSVSFQHFF